MDAIAIIKAGKAEKSIRISETYYEQLLKNKLEFDNRLLEELEVLSTGSGIKGNDAKMIKLLKALSQCKKFTNEQDEVIKSMLILWENGEVPASLTKEILKELKAQNVSDELQAFYEIRNRIPDRYFAGRSIKHLSQSDVKQVILSVFMEKGG